MSSVCRRLNSTPLRASRLGRKWTARRSPFCPRTLKNALLPCAGVACAVHQAVLAALIAARCDGATARHCGQFTVYTSCCTYQPSRVSGASLVLMARLLLHRTIPVVRGGRG